VIENLKCAVKISILTVAVTAIEYISGFGRRISISGIGRVINQLPLNSLFELAMVKTHRVVVGISMQSIVGLYFYR